MQESVNIMKNTSEELSAVKGGLAKFAGVCTSVCQILNSNDVDPLERLLLKKCLP
jgi:hypothetical protein